MRVMKKVLIALAITLMSATVMSALMVPTTSHAADSAVVFAYHRFGEDRVPATNIRLAQFEAHLRILEEGNFTVWPLPKIVEALKQGRDLPERTVALTADDAYRSVMTEAWPRLKRRGWSLTLFVGTDGVDQGIRGYLSWDEIRQFQAEGMVIGAHSAAHGHMAEMPVDRARADLERSTNRLATELGSAPDLFAYPYGETSLKLKKLVADTGYTAAFGQHSGAVSMDDDLFYLPRFAMNEAYGKPDRFLLAANSLPMRVADLVPADPLLQVGCLPRFGFRLTGTTRPDSINCFHSQASGAIRPVIDGQKLSFSVDANARPGRSRYNCTAPAGQGRWYWHGRQFVTPGGTD